MIRKFFRSFCSLFQHPSPQKLNAAILSITVLLILYVIGMGSVKLIPSWQYLSWFTASIGLASIGVSLLYLIGLLLIRFNQALFSGNKTFEQRLRELFTPICFSLLLGLFCYVLYWSGLFIVWTSEISEEKLIGQLNYPSYGKTIYVYAETTCFFDCSLSYYFWLQSGWLPVMHNIAHFESDYHYGESPQGEKALYDAYFKQIKEEEGIVKIPFNKLSDKNSFFYYNLKTGESWKGNYLRK